MTADEARLLHTVERNRFIDSLRHDATRQGIFDRAMWHLDHPVPGTDFYLKPSDRGAGAAAIYDAVEVAPLWRTLWARARSALPPKGRLVLDALLVDWRSRPAARIAGIDHKTVDVWKKNFKLRFAQCFWAWKRDFG